MRSYLDYPWRFKIRENVKQFILSEKSKWPKERTIQISKNQYPVHSKYLK